MDLSNTVRNLVSTMELLDCVGHMHNPQLRQRLVSKLPNTLRLQWGEHVRSLQEKSISLKTFSEWLTCRADAASLVLPVAAGSGDARKHMTTWRNQGDGEAALL